MITPYLPWLKRVVVVAEQQQGSHLGQKVLEGSGQVSLPAGACQSKAFLNMFLNQRAGIKSEFVHYGCTVSTPL